MIDMNIAQEAESQISIVLYPEEAARAFASLITFNVQGCIDEI